MSDPDHFNTETGVRLPPYTYFEVPILEEIASRVIGHATRTNTTPEIVIAEAVRAYFGGDK